MKLVFLPGMDGTGELFTPLMQLLAEYKYDILTLPQTGDQDYESLAKQMKDKLPKGNFILIAESFSGPIVALLSQEELKNLKGIVFVSTFLSPPHMALLRLLKVVPLKAFMKAPFRTFIYKWLCFGFNAEDSIMKSFENTVQDVPETILKARLSAISDMDLKLEATSYSALYLQAEHDRLVPPSKAKEFKNYFENLEIKTIKGPHFLLQSKPEKCTDLIKEFITKVMA